MKNFFLSGIILLQCFTVAVAQTKSNPIGAFTIHFSDYRTPALINDSSFGKAFTGNDWYAPSKLSVGFGFSWFQQLTKQVDLSGNLGGTFSNFPAYFVKNDSIGKAGFTPQAEAMAHAYALKRRFSFNPFISAGLGAGIFGGKFAAYIPTGVGFKWRFKEGAYMINQIQFRLPVTGGITENYLLYKVGIAQDNPFAKKKKPGVAKVEPIPVEPVLPPDADGDGFADANDLCPAVKGTVNGCPDTDGDGVADKDDQCPNEKGTLNGCPDSDNDGVADKNDQCPNDKGTLNGCPDSDNDGVADKEDQCKDVAGLQRYNGCPVPDSDKDGVNDEQDKCPNEAGIVANNGCPEIKQEVKQKIEFAAKNIFFQFASDVILKKSYASLNNVVTVLQQNPSLKLSISAHADNVGTPERNMEWSERRAKAVADYFISKGIAADRIAYKGYGDTQPIASNKTAKGRAANRRVEMKVDY